MHLNKKILIISIMFFFAFMHNVDAIYESNSGVAYEGGVTGGCGTTKNCKTQNYFLLQARLYYVDNGSFTQIGKTYYFVRESDYSSLRNKVSNLISISTFNSYSSNSDSYNSAYNYIKNNYLSSQSNRETLLNGITGTDNYDAFLAKDIDRTNKTKGYRLMIEPAENYANPTFIDDDSDENSALYSIKGLATEIMRLNSLGDYATESNKNKELIQGVKNKAPWLYQDTNDVGVKGNTENECSDLSIEKISDIKFGCGYKLINLDSYITDKLCYAQDGVKTKNGGLKCTKYDENNEEQYSPNYKSIGSSCVESVKLNILKDYGSLVGGTNSCGIYCNEVADVSYPGNILNPVQVGSYFAWPSRYDDIDGKYKMTVKTKLVCHTVGTQNSSISSTYQKKCPSGYEEWSGPVEVDGKTVYMDLCKATDYQEPVCPEGTRLYEKDGVETCVSKTETVAKICPEGYSKEVSETECRSEVQKSPTVCDGDLIGGQCYSKNANDSYVPNSTEKTCSSGIKVGNKCYETAKKVCESGYDTVADSGNQACRKKTGTTYSCPSGTTRQTGSGSTLKCEKYNNYYCDSGYELWTGSGGPYCWKYTNSYWCDSGYSLYNQNGETYCWKWTNYWCDSGYAKWDSAGKTCWRCSPGWQAFECVGSQNWDPVAGTCSNSAWNDLGVVNSYTDQNKIYSCGWYYESAGTKYCPNKYVLSGNYCYRYTYNETSEMCRNHGGVFTQSTSSTFASTGTCTYSRSAYTTGSSRTWTEGGWVEGTVHWDWAKGTLHRDWVTGTLRGGNYTTLTRIETPQYSYDSKKACPSGYPTSVDNTTCRKNSAYGDVSCPSDYPNEYNGKCYKKCNGTNETFINGVCRKKKNLSCTSSQYAGNNGTACYDKKAKVCDLSKSVEIDGKCYKKTVKKCDSKLVDRVVEDKVPGVNKEPVKSDSRDKVCPNGYSAEGDGKCYKYPAATDVTNGNHITYDEYTPALDQSTPATTSTRVCGSGWIEQKNDTNSYCCNGDNCYSPSGSSSCNDSFTKWDANGASYCWKYNTAAHSYHCDPGYAKWDSYGDTCWACNQTGYEYWSSGTTGGVSWEGPDSATSDINKVNYCGTWDKVNAGVTYYCPKGYSRSGNLCVTYEIRYNYNNELCFNWGGIFTQDTGSTRNGTGLCRKQYSTGLSYTTIYDWHYTEGGWQEGTAHWEWIYHKRNWCPSDYPNEYNGNCYKKCDSTYTFKDGKCIKNTNSCANKYNGKCYVACKSGYSFNSSSGKCVRKEECKTGKLISGRCYYCDKGELQTSNKTCKIGTTKVCPGDSTYWDSSDSTKCYKNRTQTNYCSTSSYNTTTNKYSYTSTGHTYVKDIDSCVKCNSGRVLSDGLCGIKRTVKLPATVSDTGNPPCYATTDKINDWSCPANYTLKGTRCVNNCSKDSLTTGLSNSLRNSASAKLKGGTNQQIDDELDATTAVSYDDSTTTFVTQTTFKINSNFNRYYNKSTGMVANSASGWNTKDVFDRKEGVISLSLTDPVTTNGVIKNYSLEIKDSKFGLVENYGQYINNYVCHYKLTNNSCKCPSGTDFAGVSLYDLTGNICNLEDNDYTCADLQYKYCNKPDKYYCKNSSNQLVDITSCVDSKIRSGSKPYTAFIECRNDTSECTKTCNYTCRGECNESNESTGNVILNITKCDGKICSLSPYCKTDGAIVSSSSLECIARKLNLKSANEVKTKLNSNSITMAQLRSAAKSCESTICGKQKVIFRTVDLNDPFYGNGERESLGLSLTNNKSRIPGSNWNSVNVVNNNILKGREQEGYKLYNKNYLYQITLTPQSIKAIREYNKAHDYNEFSLRCNDDDKTYGCISNFVHGDSDSLKDLGVDVKGVSACTSINLTTNSNDYKKCYNTKN